MKAVRTFLGISILLNVILVGCLLALIITEPSVGVRSGSNAQPESQEIPEREDRPAELPQAEKMPFRWSQLVSTNDYRGYVASLRAIGCPERTIEDIVRGDAERAFSLKRQELGLSEGGTGPWSNEAESRLVDRLVSRPQAVAERFSPTSNAGPSHQSAGMTSPGGGQPTFVERAASVQSALQKPESTVATRDPRVAPNEHVDVAGPGSRSSASTPTMPRQTAGDYNAVARGSDGSVSQNPSSSTQSAPDSGSVAVDQPGQESADDTLRAALGTQAALAQQYEHYYTNFEALILGSAGGAVVINPDELAK
jgi:hypothetical protein